MNRLPLFLALAGLLAGRTFAAQPALTIYNQNFAVVRDTVPLNLKSGENQVRFAGATAFVEPASVILRDPSGKTPLLILEQNYRGDPVSQEMLLTLNEGKTIQFEVVRSENGDTKRELISGKIIRSGSGTAQQIYYGPNPNQPVIEVKGRLQFTLPGQPMFPALGDDAILKPTLQWTIAAEHPAKLDAELSYITGGLSWECDYNLVMPERGDILDLVGWVTMDNQSGTSFDRARIKLMAGDVNKIQNVGGFRRQQGYAGGGSGGAGFAPPVTEKTFDEYHLYTLERATTLLDREKKQVEFARAEGVRSTTLYIYDGAILDPDWYPYSVRTQPEYGTACNKKIWVMREFTNSVANHLGLPLPKGRVRFYRRNTDGQMEFTGENTIEHTPRDEVVRLNTGNAFDLVGERKRTALRMDLNPSGYSVFPNSTPGVLTDPTTGLPIAPSPATNSITETVTNSGPWIDESFEITLRNHKQEPVEVRVVEHLYRWANWDITRKSDTFARTDSQTIEFRLPLKADEQRTVSYTVHYWRW